MPNTKIPKLLLTIRY